MATNYGQMIAEALAMGNIDSPYDDFANIGTQVAQTAAKIAPQATSSRDRREALIATALGGLTSGFFGGLDTNYRNRQESLYQDILTDALRTGELGEKPEGLDEALFGKADRMTKLFALVNEIKDRDTKQAAEAALEAKIVDAYLDNPREAARAEAMLKARNSAEIQEIATPVEELETNIASSGSRAPLADRIKSTALDLIESGEATPSQAYQTARDIHKADSKLLSETKTRADALYQGADELENLALQGQKTIDRAGQTGGTFAPGGIGDKLSYLWSFLSPDERAQRAAQGEMQGMTSDIIKGARPPGAGAMSDPEMMAYLKSGISAQNEPDQNRAIVAKLQNVAALNREKAGYLDWYAENYGTTDGMNELWNEYKRQEPLIVEDDKGELVWNTERRPWESVIQSIAAGSAPTKSTTPTQGVTFSSPEAAVQALVARGVPAERAQAAVRAKMGQ